MKKHGKFLAKMLSLSLALSVIAPIQAVATDAETARNVDLSMDDYTEVTVFSKAAPSEYALMSTESNSYRSDIERAKAGVIALNLDEQGLAHIEEACLNELDAMADLEGITLNEYTVLIPTAAAATPTYYGTYGGVEFYTSLSSKRNVTVEKKKFATGQKLQQWSTNAINLAMCFANKTVSIAWSLISAGLPSNYTVHTTDWSDYYINLEPITRSIYAKRGSSYLNVYNREYGMFRPYIVYHYNSASGDPTKTITLSQQMYPDLDSTTSPAALKDAYQMYTNDGCRNILMENSITFTWK